MEYSTVLPVRKYLDKQIPIFDSKDTQVGFIQRKYQSQWNKLIHYSPLPLTFLETVNIEGEYGDYFIEIKERSFISNLKRRNWDLYLNNSHHTSVGLIEDRTKISTNPRLVYHKNNREYLFKIDLFNRTCEITLENQTYATIRLEKSLPPTINAVLKSSNVSIIELLGIYYLIYLVY